MRHIAKLLIAAGLSAAALPATAQEVVVTASRVSPSGGYNSVATLSRSMPAPVLTLRRTADFAVQTVTVTGDTRDAIKRRQEIYDMIRGAIALSGKSGVELAVGQYVVEPLTMENYKNLTLSNGNRDDSDRSFLSSRRRSPGGGREDRARADHQVRQERCRRWVAPRSSRWRTVSLSVVKPENIAGRSST